MLQMQKQIGKYIFHRSDMFHCTLAKRKHTQGAKTRNTQDTRQMGIDNLLPFVCKHAPAAVTQVGTTLAVIAGKRVAIDVPIQMYRAVNVRGSDTHDVLLDWFSNLHSKLQRDRLTPVYVFDGAKVKAKSVAAAKRSEAHVRASQRARMARARYTMLQSATIDADSALADCDSASTGEEDGNTLRLLAPYEALTQASADLRKTEARLIRPQPLHYDLVRGHLSSLGARCIVAPTEAEKECAQLCADGEVDVVITDDSDALPFGAPRVLFQFGRANAYLVELAKVLAALNMSLSVFRNFCVMCGCDFVERVPNVGPAKAFPLIKDAGSIDALLAQREAARDPRFHEGVLADTIARTGADVAALEGKLWDVEDSGSGTSSVLAMQLNYLAARLDKARSDSADAQRQLDGLREFKQRYRVALSMFTTPDARC